jgi:hypothetical protein
MNSILLLSRSHVIVGKNYIDINNLDMPKWIDEEYWTAG